MIPEKRKGDVQKQKNQTVYMLSCTQICNVIR